MTLIYSFNNTFKQIAYTEMITVSECYLFNLMMAHWS
jgi:hypothetical protein